MGKLIQLVVFVAIVYFAVTKGLPMLQQGSKGGSSDDSFEGGVSGQVEVCLDQVRVAANTLEGAATVLGSPPYDTTAWSNFEDRVRGRSDSARDACSCMEKGCDEAGRALDALDGLMSSMGSAVDGGGGLSGAARDVEMVYDLIDEAAAAAREN